MANSIHNFARAVAWNPLDKEHQCGLPLYSQDDIDFYQLTLGWEVTVY